jgi:O-acetyl-ADP-ribose deacetylase (regulator of RNase III)
MILNDDIFHVKADALVNPVNTDLLLGAGIGGEIRKKGGSGIQEECLEIQTVQAGRAVVTGAGNLPFRFIIHAAVMKIGGFANEAWITGALKSAARRIAENSIGSVVLPPVGIAVGRFPLRRCAEVMIETVIREFTVLSTLERVSIVLSDTEQCTLFEETYARITGISSEADTDKGDHDEKV